MKKFLSALLFLGSFNNLIAQPAKTFSDKPQLIVGIVIDQMRADFIYRYWDRFSEGGFKRLVNGGFNFRNTHYNYIPTYTGPGHCSIYTGATPRSHGIIANDWFQRNEMKKVSCVGDPEVNSVGTESDKGKVSPRRQLSSTIGDELKMNSNQRSRVFSIALKDRSAILPAGRTADGAFWFDDATGNFITSTWYMNELPSWVKDFNGKKKAAEYLGREWRTLYPVETYSGSLADDNRYENKTGREKPVFPYDLKWAIDKKNFGAIGNSPFGNSITKELALACIRSEQLGTKGFTDMLCLSFSSPDIIGHAMGPRSVEIEDVYLRLDKDIAEILDALDKEVGRNNYLVFLTSDHGVAEVPLHLKDNQLSSGFVYKSVVAQELKKFMQSNYGDSLLIASVSNDQVFLDENRMNGLKLERAILEQKLCEQLLTFEGIAEAYPSAVLKNSSFRSNDRKSLLQNGYNHKLSGNVAYINQAGYIDYDQTGTTHGSGYNYDTHVPLIFFGKGISRGDSYDPVTITQIAPTLSHILRITLPNSAFDEPLNRHFK